MSRQTKIQEEDISLQNARIIEKFKKDFLKIRDYGFVPSNRTHNTGIGKTFEDLVGVSENNIQEVDYEGLIEIKSARELSVSMVTLFTKSPTYPEGANTYLRENYGYVDPTHPPLRILHTTISALNFNTCKQEFGFKLEVDDKSEKIHLRIKNLIKDEVIDDNIYYSFDELRNIVEKKCRVIAFINAEHKKVGDKEHFKFKDAKLLTGLTFEKFIEFVRDGTITYDIRIGVYKSGKQRGKTHDHGSGFRIQKRSISRAFEIHDL